MKGEVVHTWTHPGPGWHHVELSRDGGLYVIVQGKRLLKLDRDSELIWEREGRFHHDLDEAPDGTILTIRHQPRNINFKGQVLPVLDDLIVKIAASGEVLQEISMWNLFSERVSTRKLALIGNYVKNNAANRDSQVFQTLGVACDLFHTNAIEVLPCDAPGLGQRGDLLVSLWEINTIAVLSARGDGILWEWGPGDVWRQHQPSILGNGHLLLFDNGTRRDSSRVVELDPLLDEIVWSYGRVPGQEFFSQVRGACQRLNNGNTLITQSEKGRVIEVMPSGDVVWEFWSELDAKGEHRRAIYRMVRISGDRW